MTASFTVIPPLQFGYINYRGEFGYRAVQPVKVEWGSTSYHPESGWLLTAHDLGKGAVRDFLMRDIVTPFSDVPRAPAASLSEVDSLKRGDIMRCIDDHGTMEKIWSATS